ncbi:tight adherence protein B [Bacillus mesophilus]|uniref:Type II secretion system F family protein n=1 Tax=Bacillus mesophilus TaxID=1808955 RepID=A0A6M0Q9V8_9BACI|nr:type II secretion system F family protein [Bacillus mesophilus]MBM7661632.1 tight adherence protein B [Bacillus mesophilus]NEY72300.1 type II secretion system F family protein [Bacillus mesophilus]
MAENLVVTLTLSLIITTLVFYLLFSLLTKRYRRIESRLEKYIPRMVQETVHEKETKQKAEKSLVSNLGEQFKEVKYVREMQVTLEQAGMAIKAEEFFVLRLIVSLLSFIVPLLLGLSVLYSLGLGIIGFLAPKFYVSQKRKRRLTRSANQLAEALGIMANSMRAGFSFMQAMQLIGREMPDPIGPEFDKTIRDINYGITTETAFMYLAKRLPDKELEMVIHALLIQRTSGGNLAELLETMQETIRGRIRVKEELNTLTAEGKMSAWIVTLLPVGVGLYLNFVNPDYFSPILLHPIGWIVLGAGSLFILLGWLIIQKIIKIEV